MSKTTLPTLVRAKQIAEYLGVSVTTIWTYARERRITPIKLSERVTLFSLDEVKKNFGINKIEEKVTGGEK